MTAPGADSIPAVAESDATGDIAAIYDDLRVTLRVPLVNLIRGASGNHSRRSRLDVDTGEAA
jgi:hypothetical protein